MKLVNNDVTWRRTVAIATLVAAAGLLAAAPAQATFHMNKVREVYPGHGDDTGFVEIQMFQPEENQVGGHIVTVYDAAGTLIHTSTFQSGVAKSENQRTALIGDTNVATAFGVQPDLVDPDLNLPAAGGAACWNSDAEPSDCVAWGNFTGADKLSNATGAPVAPGGIPPGQSILRSISPGCPTLLEESDDTDNSATDWSVAPTPNPRNNATPPTEQFCAGVPNTAIDEHPAQISKSKSAEFGYFAAGADSYECKLDAAAFEVCPATGKKSYSNLTEGSHAFQVRGVNVSGPDPTPASFTWTVDTVAPTTTIDTHPADPSPGATAAFTFHANEANAAFKCSLTVQGGGADSFSSCASGKTFNNLADGVYTFKVLATDQAGNPQATPTQFSWTVDNVVADTTPPETTISTRPPDPSTSSTAAFGYTSNEPGSTFECALDGAPFAACDPAGKTYAGLANGAHTFQVRAIDPSHNVDPSPAGYTFSVAVQTAPPPPPPPPPTPPVALQTTLTGKPASRTHDSTPTFKFRASVAGAGFQCAVDHGRFKTCRSPFTTPSLKPGRHTFSVKAVANGVTDPSPAKFSFQVLKKGR